MKCTILSVLAVCFVCMTPFSRSVATNYRLNILSSNEGLSQQDVDCIAQDKQGFVWIGTYDGLNRYDGSRFSIFRHIPNDTNSISDNRILSLEEWRSRDELWIGTEGGGLNCYNLKSERFTTYFKNNAGGSGVITSLHCYDDAMWVGSVNGLSKITFDAGNRVQITPFVFRERDDTKDAQYIQSIAHDSQGNIVVGTLNGLYTKSPNETTFSLEKDDVCVKRIVKDKTGNLWIVTDNSLYFYSALQQQMKNYLSSPFIVPFVGGKGETVKSIIPITDQLLLVNTDTMLFWLHLSNNVFSFEKVKFSDNSFIDNNNLKALMMDNTLNIWITSSMDGVARFDLNEKLIYQYPINHKRAVDKIFIQALAQDGKGDLWIGSSAGCFVSDPRKGETRRIDGISEQIYGLLSDQDGNIWCTSLSGIHFFPKGNPEKKISLFDLPQVPASVSGADGPYGLCEDKKNRIVWVGMRSGALQISYEKGQFSFRHFEKSFFDTPHLSNITKFYLDTKKNELLIGTSNSGLFKAHLSEKGDILSIGRINKLEQNEKGDHVWTIFKASNGVIYEGTDSGLKQLVLGKDGAYSVAMLSNTDCRLQTYKITSIVEDDEGKLWLSTGLGLLSYNLKTEEIKEYLNTDGLSSRILSEGSLYDKKNNRLYIGSVKGLNVVELSSLKINEIAPKTVVNGIKINNSPVYPNIPFNKRIILTSSLTCTPPIVLKHYENNFTIEFASLHFSNPGKNQYAYKLEGFNSDWTFSNNLHTATFTNLSPGKYVFLVKSANCDGIWEEEPVRLEITIEPALWNTAWAYLLYSLFAGTILFLIYKYQYERRKLKHELFVEHLEHQKKIEIAEVKLKYHTNITHELRTPLSLILAPVHELLARSYEDAFLITRLQTIKNNADRLIELIGQFLDFRKIVTARYELRIKKQNLHERLLTIRNSFATSAEQKNISLELFYDVNFDCCWCDIEVVSKICYNLLSNAVKYTSDGGRVAIYVSVNAEFSVLTISIEDNGIGIEESEMDKIFDRFYQVPDAIGGTGIGLDLCRQLVTLHQGKIGVKSRRGEGTIFTVELPIVREAFDEKYIYESEDKPEICVDVCQVTESAIPQGKPLILLVEDNFELRKYMISLLSEEAKVIDAENGEAGYNLAVNHVPDMIVSDIMMPVMDGIELTKMCKENVITSHIPVILLTAKESLDSEIEGLTYGADDYIRKPFNPQTLKLKINNLIKLTRKYKTEAETAENTMNDRDRSFLADFEKIVLDNISSPDFGMDEICRLMCMSRMQLYRKMMAILTQKPSQYIKEIKMKRALELMKQKGYNITETMYEVGYTNYTHFSKLFAEVNGESPRKILGMKDK